MTEEINKLHKKMIITLLFAVTQLPDQKISWYWHSECVIEKTPELQSTRAIALLPMVTVYQTALSQITEVDVFSGWSFFQHYSFGAFYFILLISTIPREK